MPIQPVLNLSDQVMDYTIEPLGSGSGGGVPTSFVISGTVPIRINGGASADLSVSPVTVSALQFTATEPGIVPLSTGGTVKFLRADGQWVSPTGAGGYVGIQEQSVDLTARTKLNFNGPDVTAADNVSTLVTDVNLPRFSSLVGGTVPSTGGAGATSFLSANGTWSVPGVGNFLTLFPSSPGAPDTGHGRVSGTFVAQTSIGAGPYGFASALPQAAIHAHGTTTSREAMLSYQVTDGDGPRLTFRKTRGSSAAPTTVADNDLLGALEIDTINSGLFNDAHDFLQVKADGSNPNLNYLNLWGGGANTGTYTEARISKNGMRVESNKTISTNSDRARSSFDLIGSLGLKRIAQVNNFTTGFTECAFICDASGGSITASLDTSIGIEGRVYAFTKADATANTVTVDPFGAQTISGSSTIVLEDRGDCLIIISDGINWWILSRSIASAGAISVTDGITIVDPVSQINFTSGAVVTDLTGGVVGVAVSGGGGATGDVGWRL